MFYVERNLHFNHFFLAQFKLDARKVMAHFKAHWKCYKQAVIEWNLIFVALAISTGFPLGEIRQTKTFQIKNHCAFAPRLIHKSYNFWKVLQTARLSRRFRFMTKMKYLVNKSRERETSSCKSYDISECIFIRERFCKVASENSFSLLTTNELTCSL